jgi:hypothetical protein
MAKFPEPPLAGQLATIPAVERVLPTGARCWRIYSRSGDHPGAWNRVRSYGPTNARFDHHLPPARIQARGALYAAESARTCFAEVFQETRTMDRRRNDPWLVCFALTRPVVLLDLTGTWPTKAGASMAINSGSRPRARRWSQAIYDAYATVQGLYYASSMDANQPAIVFYERAASALPDRPTFHRALADAALAAGIVRVAGRFDYAVV